MYTKKDRRHRGYVSPIGTVSKKDLIKYDLFINDFYDDWEDRRDGFRDWYRDFKMIKNIQKRADDESVNKRLRMNKKQEKLLKIRKARKIMKLP
ncbi:MAG: hypothetical protein ACP5OA_05100 [Candidatus Woesearchaeota archaeon]